MKKKQYKTYYIDDLEIGQKIKFSNTVTQDDINSFAKVTGDFNPVHIDETYAQNTIFKKPIAHGFLTASYISAAIGTKLPGPGCIYLKQSLKFTAPVYVNKIVDVHIEVKSIDLKRKRVVFDTICYCDEKKVIDGSAEILVMSRSSSNEID